MRVGILGAGDVGVSLAKALIAAGHQVMLSSRTPASEKMQALRRDLGAQAAVGTVAETAAYSDFLAVALGWDAVPAVVDGVKAAAQGGDSGGWAGKTVMDLTNRFDSDSGRSAGEDLAAMTGAHVIKALNTIGAEHYQDPIFGGQAATMLIAGDDPTAKQQVAGLVGGLGFEVVDAGPLSAAVHLEALAALWVHLAFRAGQGRNTAFKLLHKAG